MSVLKRFFSHLQVSKPLLINMILIKQELSFDIKKKALAFKIRSLSLSSITILLQK